MKRKIFIILFLIELLGTFCLISSLNKKDDEGYETIHPNLVLGAIDKETGKIVSSDYSVVTKDAIKLEELLLLNSYYESRCIYTVYCYDENDNYIPTIINEYDIYYSESGTFTINDFTFGIFDNPGITHIRIMLIPIESAQATEEEVKLNWFDVVKISNSFEFKVKRKTEFILPTINIKCDEGKTVSIYYEPGMTWGEWYDSKKYLAGNDGKAVLTYYSNGHFHCNFCDCFNNMLCYKQDGVYYVVSPDSLINSNYEYFSVSSTNLKG